MMKNRQTGVTLLELMIVIAIIAIIAAFAVDNYQGSVRKTYWTEAQGCLQSFANAMERYRSANPALSYLGAAAGSNDTGTPAANVFASTCPLESNDATYNLTIQAATATTYTLQASPIAGTPVANTGAMRITSTGAKTWDKNNNGSFGDSDENNWDIH